MTRKRYIKLLMALDVQRNRANAMAYACQVAGRSYEADYRFISPWLKLAKAAREAGNAVLNMARAALTGSRHIMGRAADMVVHHALPITLENLEGGKMLIVTKQEHDALHGYSANVSFADELEKAGGGQE